MWTYQKIPLWSLIDWNRNRFFKGSIICFTLNHVEVKGLLNQMLFVEETLSFSVQNLMVKRTKFECCNKFSVVGELCEGSELLTCYKFLKFNNVECKECKEYFQELTHRHIRLWQTHMLSAQTIKYLIKRNCKNL